MKHNVQLMSVVRQRGARKAKQRAPTHIPAVVMATTDESPFIFKIVFRHVNRYSEFQPLKEVATISNPNKKGES